MDELELSEIEIGLRSILVSANIQWILDSVDEALRAGISSEKGIIIHQARGWMRDAGHEQRAIVVEPGSRQRPQRMVVTNEPFSIRQRVELIVTSIRRAVVELPTLQEEIFKVLNGTSRHQNEFIDSIEFTAE